MRNPYQMIIAVGMLALVQLAKAENAGLAVSGCQASNRESRAAGGALWRAKFSVLRFSGRDSEGITLVKKKDFVVPRDLNVSRRESQGYESSARALVQCNELRNRFFANYPKLNYFTREISQPDAFGLGIESATVVLDARPAGDSVNGVLVKETSGDKISGGLGVCVPGFRMGTCPFK